MKYRLKTKEIDCIECLEDNQEDVKVFMYGIYGKIVPNIGTMICKTINENNDVNIFISTKQHIEKNYEKVN